MEKFEKLSQNSEQIPYFFDISLVIRQSFFLPKQFQKSRSILKDGSRSFGLFRKGKTCIIAKFHWTDLVNCSHSREGKTLSYRLLNTVISINVLRECDMTFEE